MKPSRLTATKAGLPVTKKKKPIGRVQHAQSNRKDSSSCSGLLLFIIGIFIFATINILQNDSIINIKARISQIHSLPSLPSLPSLYSRQSLRTNVEEVPPSVTNKEDVEVSEIPLKTREVKLETLVDTFRSKSLETEPTSKGSTTSSLTSSLITSKVDKNKNKKKKASRYPKEPDQPYIDYGYERHIKKIIGEKTGVRQDLRVVLPDLDYAPFTRPPGDPSNILGAPRAYVAVRERLEHLPLLSYLKDNKQGEPSLESTMMYLHTLPMCADKPVFLTMATVGDDLYWQLIENYVYTMVKFDTVECSIVVCVSDPKCVRLCDENFFPCFNFKSEVNPLPSVMEQIGELKLFHVPRALESGVDVFMLDLDVGFLYSPMVLVKAFYATPHVDIFVQEDIIWVMNRSAAAWKTWTSQMLPNIGMFLCRGNNKTARVFSIAWGHYNNVSQC